MLHLNVTLRPFCTPSCDARLKEKLHCQSEREWPPCCRNHWTKGAKTEIMAWEGQGYTSCRTRQAISLQMNACQCEWLAVKTAQEREASYRLQQVSAAQRERLAHIYIYMMAGEREDRLQQSGALTIYATYKTLYCIQQAALFEAH